MNDLVTITGPVSRLSLLQAGVGDDVLARLGDIEKKAGFRTGERFSLEGRTTHHVTVDMESSEFFISDDVGPPVPLTREAYDHTSGLCYWRRT
ncbi:hypothetical protein D3C71_157690 [compost metagenome]